MKKNKPVNKFDNLVENLTKQFLNIRNLDLIHTDNDAKKVFNTIVYRMSEIISYKELICQSYVPATNKSIFESQKDYKESKYRNYLNINEIDFKETLYETIRLAYVGLFHKLENYINDIAVLTDIVFKEHYTENISIIEWAKLNLQFNIRDWQQFYVTHKINWICNCVKHKDGYPVKTPKPQEFENTDENIRIRVSPEEFKSDCDLLIQMYQVYLNSLFVFAQYRLTVESYHKDEENNNELEEMKNKMEGIITEYMDSLKRLR